MKLLRELITTEGGTAGRPSSRPFIPPGFTYFPTGKRCGCQDCIGKWIYLKDGMCPKHAEPMKPPPKKQNTPKTQLRKLHKAARERERLRALAAN